MLINIFGQPGAGKSTAAAWLFSKLKMSGYSCELVTEYAKDCVWENRYDTLKNQVYLFGKQFHRINRCVCAVDAVITDSPLLLNLAYEMDSPVYEELSALVYACCGMYENINFFLERAHPYDPVGRTQTEEEADILSGIILGILCKSGQEYKVLQGNEEGLEEMYKDIVQRLGPVKELPF